MADRDIPLAMSARLTALAVAAFTAVSLVAQLVLSYAAEGTGSVVATLWWMAGYFTILTNLLVAVTFAFAAVRGAVTARWIAGVTLAIVLVALVYHPFLAGLRNLEGIALWVDHGLHSAVPALVLLWWIAFAPRDLALHDLPSWLVWPAVYTVYALARGTVAGFWAYPFLNIDMLGWASVARNVVGLLAAFAILGLALIGLARRLDRRSVR
jgi:hypothetical protein